MGGLAKGNVTSVSDRQTARGTAELTDTPCQLSLSASMIERLESLRGTPVDERWANAVWPSEETFDAALLFIRSLPADMLFIPDIGLADDGEVNFLWKNDAIHVDLGFHEAKSFSYFARTSNGREFLADGVPADRGLPPEIVALLTAES